MASTTQESRSQNYVLYHHLYSICSIMVRYTIAVAGLPRSPAEAMHVEDKIVNIFAGEQLEKHFLTTVNRDGLVPVLTDANHERPLPDSQDITWFIAKRYPSLCPDEHRERIEKLLFDLHDLNYFSLSFGTRPQMADQLLGAVDERLQGDIDDEYRAALEYKRKFTKDHKWEGVQSDEISRNEAKARALMKKLDGLLPANKQWLFGLARPTTLDAHLVIFIARMKDVGRAELITPGLLEYFDFASNTAEYKRVMDGRKTMIAE